MKNKVINPKVLSRRFLLVGGGLGICLPKTSLSAVPPYVVSTIRQISQPLQTMLEESATVESIIKGNLDPHSYIPVRSDIRTAAKSDVFIHNGLNLEAQMSRLIRQLSASKPVFSMAEFAQNDIITSEYNEQPILDPHLWMSPPIWGKILSGLWERLRTVIPNEVKESHENFIAYMENINDLHNYAQKTLSSIPSHNRILVTSHDAFGYFGQTYGIGVYGIQGISTQSETSIRHINKISEMLARNLVPAIFVETSVGDHFVYSIQENVRRLGGDVALGGRLFSDAMGEEGSYRGTYIGMIDHNITSITLALGGEAPSKGMLGLL